MWEEEMETKITSLSVCLLASYPPNQNNVYTIETSILYVISVFPQH